ncbi:unnamed protein product [Urochloa decumbens]|uniref:Ubiquitin thioesterase OTU n=1 Tax=Urochloa decumbens TaxID=240449 RepID=A0ABC9FTX0_9POAL
MCSESSQLPGKLTQRMGLWNTPCSQTLRHHARIGSVKKNINSSHLQTTACFVSLGQPLQLQCRLSTRSYMLNVKSDIRSPSNHKFASIGWHFGSTPQKMRGIASGQGFAVSGMASAEGPVDNNVDSTQPAESPANLSHGKKVYTDYSVTGIPGDGRCLFRSVAHGACIRSGKPIPSEDHQRKLADDLRTMVADEFIKRRAETEWFVEGDFDTYVSQIRKPRVGRMPITVYMHDKEAGGLIAIAEYGQEYGTEAPVQVLYHGYGHYEALQIPGKGGPRSRL